MEVLHTFWSDDSAELHELSAQKDRQKRARGIFIDPIYICIEDECARIKDYAVSLESCTCGDWIHRHLPCKHMYRLAHALGLFDLEE